MKLRALLFQNLDGIFLRENFLISSVVTIFIIRFFLKVTDYPQLSGAGLHIAHLLWGGLFMLLAFIILFSFLGRGLTVIASVLAGIGFGAFIDELGKFLTSDNNYFFQPTIAILYVVFVLLYIFSKALSQERTISEKEYLVNALEMVAEAVMNDLDSEEKRRAVQYLAKSDQKDPLVKALYSFISEVQSIPPPRPSIVVRIKHVLADLYVRTTRSRILSRTVVLVLLLQSLYNIFSVLAVLIVRPSLSFIETGELASSFVSAIVVLFGLLAYQRSKISAYRMFKIAILITLLVTQFFTFYEEQFRALMGLGINIILLAVVDYALDREERVK